MATVTAGGNAWTTAAGNKTVTLTPAVGDLIVVVCANSGRTPAQPPTVTDNNPGGAGAYVQVAVAGKLTDVDAMWVFIRTAKVLSASSTIVTFAPAGGLDTGGGLEVYRVAGLTKNGAAALKQQAVVANFAGGGTPSVVMGAAILTGNPVIGGVFTGTNSSTNTAPPTGWTEDMDLGYNTPASGLETARISSGETRSTIPWTAATASSFCAIVVELDTTPNLQAPAITVTFTVTPTQSRFYARAAAIAVTFTLTQVRRINKIAAITTTLTASVQRQFTFLRALAVTFAVAPIRRLNYIRAITTTVTVAMIKAKSFVRVIAIPVTVTVSSVRSIRKTVAIAVSAVVAAVRSVLTLTPAITVGAAVPLSVTVGVSITVVYTGTQPTQWNEETRRRYPEVTIDKVQD